MEDSPTIWKLETENCVYIVGLNKAGTLVNIYWGKKLPSSTDYPIVPESEGWASFDGPAQVLPEEFPVFRGMFYQEPCLKATFSDGVRDTVLMFDFTQTSQDGLRIDLKDVYYPLRVELHYRVHAKYDLIERWAEIYNESNQPITLERIFSAKWHFPNNQTYYFSHLAGRWYEEFRLYREELTPGVKVLESRRITTSHHHNPWFAIDKGLATETDGEVWFGALAWSGNWKLTAEVANLNSTSVSIGINDWDFSWKLEPGMHFTTPSAICGYTKMGFGAASRKLHDFIREQVLPHGQVSHKVLYNSWEATLFDVNELAQSKLAEIAASIGVELFIVDDGWFNGRNSDRVGLGDWWPDPSKFPNGLQPLIKKVNDLGMSFGLWVEPEMVNPDSDLYRAHSDWILHFPNRKPTLARNQCILNMAREDVQGYLLEKIDTLLSLNNISFIKWDMNRNVSEPGWVNAPGDPKEIWVRYVQGVYMVWGELRKRHPNVTWQSCSGGGGRADIGILNFADQIWVSDNTAANLRLQIQKGFSQVFPAITMEAWVTDVDRGKLPLSYRFHVSMCGCLGIGGNLTTWDKNELDEAAFWISRYKSVREIIQFGDQFRLENFGMQYMSKNGIEGVFFAFGMRNTQIKKVQLSGLHVEQNYEIEGFPGKISGKRLMEDGLFLPLAENESVMRGIHLI